MQMCFAVIVDSTTDLEKKAFGFYGKQCMSVELVKDDQLQKKYFRVENQVSSMKITREKLHF